MQLGWGLLTMVLLAAAVLWFWQDSLAARESDRSQRRIGLGAPRRVPGQQWQHVLHLRRRPLDEFDGTVALDRSGAFGYTVRVVPHNDRLVSAAELGLVALPV